MFTSLLNNDVGSISISSVLICTAASLILGFILSAIYLYSSKGKCSKSFAISVAILPAVVQMVIILVSGNLGAGVAVVGAFSLVRFRSAPGTSKEISIIFLAMAIGLASGMGYITFAIIFLALIALVFLILTKSPFAENKTDEKTLRITIPETLDYTGVFDDIFDEYTHKSSLVKVKTTNLGSMFELTYDIILKDSTKEKSMLDDIRCRNGNLTIICSKTAESETL